MIEVETSPDYWVWSKDARYQYYKHGPLARMELGDQQVQGLDYAYTLQGWLKGVNGNSLFNGQFNMGGDGAAAGLHKYVASQLEQLQLISPGSLLISTRITVRCTMEISAVWW